MDTADAGTAEFCVVEALLLFVVLEQSPKAQTSDLTHIWRLTGATLSLRRLAGVFSALHRPAPEHQLLLQRELFLAACVLVSAAAALGMPLTSSWL